MIIMQKTVFDTNLVIGVLEDQETAQRVRRALKGKAVRIIICETVLREVRRVRAWSTGAVLAGLRRVFGEKRVETAVSPERLRDEAQRVRDGFEMAHAGDDMILALCRMRGFALITFDRSMLRVAQMLGILAFHPRRAGDL